jgi:dolichyl-phosphate beta-glucosyltransferase
VTLSIVIPAFNEVARLPQTLAAIAGFFTSNRAEPRLAEVIVVDDGSSDGTADLAQSWDDRLPVRVIRLGENQGKGAAVRRGMLEARGDLLLMYDADGATPISEVPRLWDALQENGAHVAIGSRVDPRTSVSMSLHRRLIGRLYHGLCARLHPGIRDAACGCKLFTADAARLIFSNQRIDRFAFDVEILSFALRRGLSIVEVPVQWSAIEKSKVRLLRDGAQMLWSILMLYWRKWFDGSTGSP